jgi:RNA polymerase-binding transcription factor DksA
MVDEQQGGRTMERQVLNTIKLTVLKHIDTLVWQYYRQTVDEIVNDLYVRQLCIKPNPTVDEIFTMLFEKRILTHISGAEAKELHSVLERFQRGTFGLCERCGQEVDSAELARVPAQRFCSGCLKSKNGLSATILPATNTIQITVV